MPGVHHILRQWIFIIDKIAGCWLILAVIDAGMRTGAAER
jgi:hypothetical protein